MPERRNDPEIMEARAIACTTQLGSISSLRCQKTCRRRPFGQPLQSDVSRTKLCWPSDRVDQTIWWSQTGSNRRPHACKARALPAELWPRIQKTNAAAPDRHARLSPNRAPPGTLRFAICVAAPRVAEGEAWWAWEDLNFRPHAYQARALTN